MSSPGAPTSRRRRRRRLPLNALDAVAKTRRCFPFLIFMFSFSLPAILTRCNICTFFFCERIFYAHTPTRSRKQEIPLIDSFLLYKTVCLLPYNCSLAQLEALRQVAAPVGKHLVLARELVRVAEGWVALLRPNLLRACGNVG